MFKLLLSLLLVVGNLNIASNKETKLEEIKFINLNKESVELKITIDAPIRDIIELKITFYDKDKNKINGEGFSKAISIIGKKQTTAKIPFNPNEKIYFNTILFSSNLNKEIENIYFPIYPSEALSCSISKNKLCESNYPSVVTYSNGKIKEEYEKIGLVNNNLTLEIFNNFIPIERISVISNLTTNDGYATLYLKEKIKELDIYYNEVYIFPLKIKEKNNVINFEFASFYYLNVIEGKTYENYQINTKIDKKVLLPYINEKYSFYIEIKDEFISFSSLLIEFEVVTNNKLFGKCSNSKYCIRRNYL